MKIALIVFVFAASVLAQQKVRLGQEQFKLPPACGPERTTFKVKLDDRSSSLLQPDAGKALVYFIHEAGTLSGTPLAYPTTRLAMDGNWIGANHGDSWFALPVEPGEHHVCVALQSSLVDQRVELAHFNAEPGQIYYYRTRLVLSGEVELLELGPIDSDQGKYFVGMFPMSLAKPKD